MAAARHYFWSVPLLMYGVAGAQELPEVEDVHLSCDLTIRQTAVGVADPSPTHDRIAVSVYRANHHLTIIGDGAQLSFGMSTANADTSEASDSSRWLVHRKSSHTVVDVSIDRRAAQLVYNEFLGDPPIMRVSAAGPCQALAGPNQF
jgi:hypothetical protein